MFSHFEAKFEAGQRFQQLTPITWPVFRRLLNAGVPSAAIVWPDLPALADAVFFPDRPIFDLADDVGHVGSESAVIFLARDDMGEPADMVAWSLKTSRVASWLAIASLLGAEALMAPRIGDDGALSVFQTPLDWLRAGRRGVVIVEPTGAAPLLREAEPLLASSVEHGRRLRSIVTAKPPRILVPIADSRRAA